MKDADVAEHSLAQTEQAVISQTATQEIIPPKSNFLSTGRFAPGNNIHELSSKGRGLANTPCLVEDILANETMADVHYALQPGRAEGLPLRKLAAYNRVRDYIYNNPDTIDRVEGAVAKETRLTGKNGGPITIVTADATELLMELSGQEESKR